MIYNMYLHKLKCIHKQILDDEYIILPRTFLQLCHHILLALK